MHKTLAVMPQVYQDVEDPQHSRFKTSRLHVQFVTLIPSGNLNDDVLMTSQNECPHIRPRRIQLDYMYSPFR